MLVVSLAGCTGAHGSTAGAVGSVVVTGLPSGHQAEVADAGSQPGPSADLDMLSDVFSIGPSGPLGDTAHVTIPLRRRAQKGTTLVAVTREGPAQPWDYLPAVLDASGTTASFDTTHFSFFGIVSFDPQKLAQQFQDQFLNTVTSGLTGTVDKPTCQGENDARGDGYHVTSSSTDTVYWCFGVEGGQRVLKVTNNAGFPLQVLHPNMQVLANPHDYLALSSLSRFGSGGYAIIAPGVTATFDADLTAGGSEGISTSMDGFGQSLYALQVGVESLLEILARLGVGGSPDAERVRTLLVKVLDANDCASALDQGPGGWVAGCLGTAVLKTAFGGVELLLAPLMAAGKLAQFLRSEWNALKDQFTGHDQYRIVITRDGAPAGVSAKDLLTAPVPSLCQHPAGQLVNGELPGLGTSDGFVNLAVQASPAAAAPAFADFTGDGNGDAAAVAQCSAGGVSWPEHVLFYSSGPQLIGDLDLSTVFSDEHADVQTMTVHGQDLVITWRTYTGAGTNFRTWTGSAHWNGTTMQLTDVQQTG